MIPNDVAPVQKEWICEDAFDGESVLDRKKQGSNDTTHVLVTCSQYLNLKSWYDNVPFKNLRKHSITE